MRNHGIRVRIGNDDSGMEQVRAAASHPDMQAKITELEQRLEPVEARWNRWFASLAKREVGDRHRIASRRKSSEN